MSLFKENNFYQSIIINSLWGFWSFQLGIWGVPLSDVSVCSLAELHSLDIHLGGYLHGEVLCHRPSNNVQADFDSGTSEGKYQIVKF